jgi:hypothetical protein
VANAHPPIPEKYRKTEEELNDYREKVEKYLISMSTFKQMYKRGIIDKSDFAVCDKLMAEKYGIPDNSIHRFTDPDK